MAVLGLLILALAAALTVDVVLENMKTLRPDPMVIGQTVSSINVGTLFLSGVVIGVLGMLGLSLPAGRAQARAPAAPGAQGARPVLPGSGGCGRVAARGARPPRCRA